jgi:hypothetical protein
MDKQRKTPSAPPTITPGERIWRNTFFVLSASLAGLALVQFDAGRLAHGLGDLGASILMVSLIAQYPFVRAVIRASAEDDGTPERAKRRQEDLLKQAAELKAAHPWADVAGRAGWILLGISLVLRFTGTS